MAVTSTPTKQADNPEPTKKKHRIWPWFVAIIVVMLFIPLVAWAWSGFMPGVSSLIGTNKAKDLGVRYTPADFESYKQKTGAKFVDTNTTPAPNGQVFADPKQMDVNLTQEEITAMLNSNGWVYMPLKNTQVRLTSGTIEVSGNINGSAISNFAKSFNPNYSQKDINDVSGWAKLFGNPPIYIKANASITNNELNINIVEAKVGFFNMPESAAKDILKNGPYNLKNNTALYDIQSATVTNGQLHFVGIAPTTIYVKK